MPWRAARMAISTRRLWKKEFWTEEERVSLLLRERRERWLDALFAARAHDLNLLSDGACRRLQVPGIDLQCSDCPNSAARRSGEPPAPVPATAPAFCDQCVGELAHAGDIAGRPVERRNQVSFRPDRFRRRRRSAAWRARPLLPAPLEARPRISRRPGAGPDRPPIPGSRS